MYRPSLTAVLSVAFLGYMGHSMWNIAKLYIPPSCSETDKTCISNMVKDSTELSLLLFTTTKHRPTVGKDLVYVGKMDVSVNQEVEEKLKIKVPKSVTKNGTMYLSVFAVPKLNNVDTTKEKWWQKALDHPHASYVMTRLTQYMIPEAETFQLLGSDDGESVKPQARDRSRSVTHLRSIIVLSVMTDQVRMSPKDVPGELSYVLQLTKNRKEYLPLLYVDELTMRIRDLVIVNATDKSAEVNVKYQPISFGKLRLFLQFTSALGSMQGMGFTEKDTDEVKGIFSDTNLVLLLVTFGVSAVHLLFDFLAFKNDISFWRRRSDMVGLSTGTILWRAFSHSVIFLYLMDSETSLLVLIPAGIGALIEIWKVTKAFKVQVTWSRGWRPSVHLGTATAGEASTAQLDGRAMRYLSWLLVPLCVGGSVYSLVYTPHKSWYSWTIQTTVNGVYAFGFLFMLPQLFLNYKLKSVAHLPWRSFMYKAFNTFIDDLFAFIITMPTAHRVACFRDDVVFIVYLYQRYLYPVDKTRIDTSTMMDEDSVEPNGVPSVPVKHTKQE